MSSRSPWDGLTEAERAARFESYAEAARVGLVSHGVCTCRQCEAWMLQESYFAGEARRLREGDGDADSE